MKKKQKKFLSKYPFPFHINTKNKLNMNMLIKVLNKYGFTIDEYISLFTKSLMYISKESDNFDEYYDYIVFDYKITSQNHKLSNMTNHINTVVEAVIEDGMSRIDSLYANKTYSIHLEIRDFVNKQIEENERKKNLI